MMKITIANTFGLLAGSLAFLHAQKDNKWDVNQPPFPLQEVEFTVTEGTWMNLDVSPDGKTIVFDMLGDIYTIPVTGGTATALRTGIAYEVQPRFSPDGKYISFTSDAGGGDNIWIMKTDGSNGKQITKEDFRLLNNAVWTTDGNYLVARKHFTSTRSAGAGEMWMYHISGGSGFQLTKRKNDQQDAGEPWMSPDGKYVYYSEDIYPGGYFQYNKDPNSQIYVIRRYNMTTGETDDVVSGPGGAVRPVLSRSGNQLAFVRRVREKSVLFIHDLKTGISKPLYDELSKDQQEAWAIFGVYSNFNFTPDDRFIIIWAGGKIRKIETATGKSGVIPFTVNVKHQVAETVKFPQVVDTDSFTVKAVRNAITSPDGKWLVFNAAGYLYKKALPNGKPVRLTNGTDLEFEPAFSADGSKLVYVSWNDEQSGSIRIIDWAGKNTAPVTITKEKGIYRQPSFSPDKKQLVYVRESGNTHLGFAFTVEPGIYIINADGYSPKKVSKEGEYPRFSPDGKRIYYQTGGYLFGALSKGYHSVNTEGFEKQTHFTSKYANAFVPSPDFKWLAFTELYKVYVIPFPAMGKAVELSGDIKGVPIVKVSKEAGISLHWSKQSAQLHWTLGPRYFTAEVDRLFPFLRSEGDTAEATTDTIGIDIGLKLKTDRPEGRLALTNARIITMKGDEVIENGTIIIKDNRIESIGKAAEISVPSGTKIIDCSGKTIIPGYIDVHAHTGNFRYGLSPQKQWEYYANLAYGVTTTHDPSTNSEMVFSQSEMIRSGIMTGPRLYSTGTILYGADGDFKAVINGPEDAEFALKRTQAFGAFSVKSYNQPRRDQRQQVIAAAHKLNMLVVPEGGSHFFHNMSMVVDGHTAIEHNIPVAPLYDDVVQLWKRTRTSNTPTLIVSYGSVSGEYYWYEKTNAWEKTRLLNFTPRPVIDSRSRHVTHIPDAEYDNGHILVSRSCKKLHDAGVRINLGSHGQIQGIGAHWEIWMLVQGGMTPLQALQSATINGALHLGMEKEIGSLEAGKLADLQILDQNPLENISNTESLSLVMLNGRLYDAETLNETGNYQKTRGKFFWEMFGDHALPENLASETNGCSASGCTCGK